MVRSANSSAFATLAVYDLTVAAHWHRNVLGFVVLSDGLVSTELPILVHLRWARDQDLVLVAASSALHDGANRLGEGVTSTFVADDDVDALAARARLVFVRHRPGPA